MNPAWYLCEEFINNVGTMQCKKTCSCATDCVKGSCCDEGDSSDVQAMQPKTVCKPPPIADSVTAKLDSAGQCEVVVTVDSSKTVAYSQFYSRLGLKLESKNPKLGDVSWDTWYYTTTDEIGNWRGCVDTPADWDKVSTSFLSRGRKTCGHFVETGWCAAPLTSNAVRDNRRWDEKTAAEKIAQSGKQRRDKVLGKPKYIAIRDVGVTKRMTSDVPKHPEAPAYQIHTNDVVEVEERKMFKGVMQLKISTVLVAPKASLDATANTAATATATAAAAGHWVSTEDENGDVQLSQNLPLTDAEIMQTAAWHTVHNMPSPAAEKWHSAPEADLEDAYENCCACGGGKPTEGTPVYVYYHVVPRDYKKYSCDGDNDAHTTLDEAQCNSRIAKTIIRAQELSNAKCGAFQGRELVQMIGNEHRVTFRPDKAGQYKNARPIPGSKDGMDLITFTAIQLQPSKSVYTTNVDCFINRQNLESVELMVDSVDVDFFIDDMFGKDRAESIQCDMIIASLDATLYNDWTGIKPPIEGQAPQEMWLHLPPSPDPPKYVVKTDQPVVRTAFSMDSPGAPLTDNSTLQIGQTVTAQNETLNLKGATQIQYAGGWVSVEAIDGTVQLEKIVQAVALECLPTSIPGRCRCGLPAPSGDTMPADLMFIWPEQRPASQTSTTARDIVVSIDVWLPADGPTMATTMLTISDRVLGDPIRLDDSCPHGWHNFDGDCYRVFAGPYVFKRTVRATRVLDANTATRTGWMRVALVSLNEMRDIIQELHIDIADEWLTWLTVQLDTNSDSKIDYHTEVLTSSMGLRESHESFALAMWETAGRTEDLVRKTYIPFGNWSKEDPGAEGSVRSQARQREAILWQMIQTEWQRFVDRLWSEVSKNLTLPTLALSNNLQYPIGRFKAEFVRTTKTTGEKTSCHFFVTGVLSLLLSNQPLTSMNRC
jgi:hypothetical protein